MDLDRKNMPVTYFSSSHGKIAYQDSGGGHQPLIFMHGLPTSKELWYPVLEHLPETYRIILFDLNDYGQSEKIGRPISHQERADVLEELRQHLQLSTFTLIAHDLGSSVALDYMGKHGQAVDKLVLMSPPIFPDFVEPNIVKLVRIRVLGEMLVWILRPFLFNIGIKQGLTHKERFTPELQAAFADPYKDKHGRAALLRNLRWGRPYHVFRDYPEIMKAINAPTLILQGRQDPYIPVNQATRAQKMIPNAHLIFVEDGSHFLPIDTPKVIADSIYDFL